jgi:hypothetical protein
MGYYHLGLNPYASRHYTVVLQLGGYTHLRPAGLFSTPENFEGKMSELMYCLGFARAYFDDLPVSCF